MGNACDLPYMGNPYMGNARNLPCMGGTKTCHVVCWFLLDTYNYSSTTMDSGDGGANNGRMASTRNEHTRN